MAPGSRTSKKPGYQLPEGYLGLSALLIADSYFQMVKWAYDFRSNRI
jgi:hypothetical protein